MKARGYLLTALVLCLALAPACGGRRSDDTPSVKILSPPNQHSISLGQSLRIESRAKDDNGVRHVELRVNGIPVDRFEIPEGEKSFLVEQTWVPPELGTYLLTVIALDSKDQQSAPATVTIFVQPAPTPTESSLPTPEVTPVPTLTPTAEQETPEPGTCTYDATFVADVTIPDNTPLAPGTEFIKTWRLRNTGTCDWGKGFHFVFTGGEQLGGPASIPIPPTPSGATLDISVPFQAPDVLGRYRSTWRIRTPDGEEFGERPFVQILVRPLASPTPVPTPTATPAPKPDLDITLVAGDLELLVNETLALRVTVRNNGPGATDRAALVRAVLRPGLEIESSVPTLPVGGEGVASINHTFGEPADLEVLISVDPEDEITEENEENNTERIPVVVNPQLYVTDTITATPGLRFDLDDGADEEDRLDIEWRVVEGSVYLGLLNGTSAAPLSGEAGRISYALAAGLTWEREQLALIDLLPELMFGFQTSDGRVGYARVEAVLDDARTSARLTYLVWDWP